MAIYTQTQNLNLIPGIQTPTTVHLSAGNVGDTIKFHLYKGSEVFDASGYTVSVHGIRADGGVFGPFPVTTYDGTNEVTFAVRSEMTAVSGAVVAELTIASNSAIVGTANFALLVENAAFPAGVTYDTDPSVYQQILAYAQTGLAGIQSSVNALKSAVGSPLVAATAAAMTNTSKIYVYTGSESGYTAGNWYYYNGSAWTSGGVYNSTALNTDKMLELANNAADARITGSGIGGLTAKIGDSYDGGIEIAPPTTLNSGDITAAARNTVFTANSSSLVMRGYLSVTPGDMYAVTSNMTAQAATNGYFALVATDSSNVVLDAVPYTNTATGDTTNVIVIPGGATRLWIVCYGSTASAYKGNTKVIKYTKVTLADEVATVGGKYYKKIRDIGITANVVTGKRITAALYIGDTITFGDNANFCYSYATVSGGESYRVTVRESTSLVGYWVYLTTSTGTIRQMLMPKSGNPVAQIPNTAIITIPENLGISKMYVQSYVNNETNYDRFTKVELMEEMSVSDGVTDTAKALDHKVYKTTGEKQDLSVNIVAGQLFTADDLFSPLTTANNDYNSYSRINVNGGESFKVTINTSSNYFLHYVVFTNNSDIVVGRAMRGNGVGGSRSEFVTVPVGATRMYILSFVNNSINYLRKTFCENAVAVSQLDLTKELAADAIAADNLPAYYTPSWLSTRLSAVRTNCRVNTGINFGFISDTHMQANDGNSKYLARYVLENSTVPFFVFGGDAVRAYGTREELEGDAEDWFDWVKYVGEVYQVRGNHDFIIKSSEDETVGYTEPESYVYDYLIRPKEMKIVPGGVAKFYYMIEDKAQKVRILCLNPYKVIEAGAIPWNIKREYDQAQIDWFIDRIKEVEGYSFVVVVHESPDTSGNIPVSGTSPAIKRIEEAVNNRTTISYSGTSGDNVITVEEDFTETTNTIVCNLSGHNHKDRSNVENGVLSITIAADAHYNDDTDVTTRTAMTTTEQAFDIFSIDTTNRTIKAVRFGGGANRSWTY